MWLYQLFIEKNIVKYALEKHPFNIRIWKKDHYSYLKVMAHLNSKGILSINRS